MSEITLVYPKSDRENENEELDERQTGDMPFGLMGIATFMKSKGYKVNFIDCRAYSKKECEQKLLERINRQDLIGFSVMTVQVPHAFELTKKLKEKDSGIKVMWGGIHPTLFPDQTLRCGLIDYVCFGEGEHSLLGLMRHLEGKIKDISKIRGLCYKKGGKVCQNEKPELIDVEDLPDLDYNILEIKKYIRKTLLDGTKVKSLGISTSRGCPYRCAFCTNTFLTARKWRAFNSKRVLDFTKRLVDDYGLNHFMIIDDFFFGNKQRANEIVDGLMKERMDLLWEANIRANNFSENQVNDVFMEKMKKSGCFSLRMGLESGSDRVLEILKKDITTKDSMNAIRQCKKHDIIPLCYFMVGIPGESMDEIMQTFSFILQLYEINPNAEIIVPGIFRPYPGGELYNECVRMGFNEPRSLEEWADTRFDESYLGASKIPWIEQPELVEAIRKYYVWFNASRQKSRAAFMPIIKVMGLIAEARLKNRAFGMRADLRLFNLLKKAMPYWRG